MSRDIVFESAHPELPAERAGGTERWAELQRTALRVRTRSAVGETDAVTPTGSGPARRAGILAASGVLSLGALSAFQMPLSATHASAMLGADSQLFSLTNQDRTSNGVPAAQWNNTLGAVGESWTYTGCGFAIAGRAQDMINRQYFSHQLLNCGNQYVFNMFQAAGLHYGWAGENIGWNNNGTQSSSVVAIDQAFMASPDHRANILNANYDHMGMGSAYGTFQGVGGASMYTEEFIQATSPLPQENPPAQTVPAPVMNGVPGTSGSTDVQLSWAASQGVSSPTYTVWVEVNGLWSVWTTTSGTSATFIGAPGTSYGFAIEVSGSGYDSGRPGSAQQSTTISGSAGNPEPFNGLYATDMYGRLHEGSSPLLYTSGNFTSNIIRGIALNHSGRGGYTLDAYGGLHPFGNAPGVANPNAYWPGWDITRGIALRPDGESGYILDAFGGLHAFGGAPQISTPNSYWPGWDVARGIVLRPDGNSGYVMDAFGGLHPFGGAPSFGSQAGHYWPGWEIARGVALNSNGTGGYIVDGFGGLHQFGNAPFTYNPNAYWPNWDIARGVTMMPGTTNSGWIVDGFGGFHAFGSAPQVQAYSYSTGQDVVRAVAAS